MLNEQSNRKKFVFAVEVGDHIYRVTVDALTSEDARREIVHTQMEKGFAVKRIVAMNDRDRSVNEDEDEDDMIE